MAANRYDPAGKVVEKLHAPVSVLRVASPIGVGPLKTSRLAAATPPVAVPSSVTTSFVPTFGAFIATVRPGPNQSAMTDCAGNPCGLKLTPWLGPTSAALGSQFHI